VRYKIIVILLMVFSYSSLSANSQRFEELISAGIALHDKGKYREAIAIYKSALHEDGSKALVNYEIAYSYIQLKDYSEAEKYLRECIRYDENYYKAFSQLGWIYHEQDRRDLSSKMYLYSYLKSIEKNRKDITPLNNIIVNFKTAKDQYAIAKHLVFTFPNDIVFLRNLSLIDIKPSKEQYQTIAATNAAELREGLIKNISNNIIIPKSEKSIFMALAYKSLGDYRNFITHVDIALTSEDEAVRKYAAVIKKESYELRPYYSEDVFIEYVWNLLK
jgi:tetratricopeptide (TPR) repeat protein